MAGNPPNRRFIAHIRKVRAVCPHSDEHRMPDMTMLTPTLYADNDLTIYHAQAIKQRWLEGLHQSEGDVTLDLSRVGEIDTAGLQLLWLLRREAHASGRRLNIVAVSPAVADLLAFAD